MTSASQRARRVVTVTFTRRKRAPAPQRTSAPLGARYVAGVEEFYPSHYTREGLVLRHVSRSRSHVMEECSGPCDPERWRYSSSE